MRTSRMLVALLVLTASGADGSTLRVPAEYATVQGAIDHAAYGDTVLVAAGSHTASEVRTIYYYGIPYAARSCAFLKAGVTVASEGGSGVTALDMAGLGHDTVAAVVIAFNQPEGPVHLEGFTLTGAALGGQGVHAHDSGLLTVRDCIIEDFDGTSRGAAGGFHATRSPIEIYDSAFRRCRGTSGGGLIAHESDVLVEGCLFEECDTGLHAWAITGSNSITVRNSRFERNTTSGIRKGNQMHFALIEDCWFADNTSAAGLQALSIYSGPITVQRCVFVNNSSVSDGAALKWQAASSVIQYSTFVSSATLGGGTHGSAIKMISGGNVTLTGNILAGSTGAPALLVGSNVNLSDSCNLFWNNADGDVQGVELDASTVFADPEFCSPELRDFTVAKDSPCLTTEGCDTIGALGNGCDPISITPDTWANIKARFRGNASE